MPTPSEHPHREALRSYYLTGQPIPDWPLAASIPRPAPGLAFCDLASARLAAARRPAQARLLDELTTARDRALEVLQPVPSDEESFGAGAARFLDIKRLAALPSSPGRQALPVARRQRLSAALGTLEEFLAGVKHWPAFWSLDLPAAFDHAAALLQQLSGVLRALRVVQLECDGTYDESRHPNQIARLQASPADLLSAPPILAIADAADFETLPIGAWIRFLHSQVPVTVLLHAAGSTTFDLPLLRLAFGHALVGQTALSQADHLHETVEQIGAATGPAVILYSSHAWAPLFRHSPESGLEVHQCSTEAVPPQDAPVIPPSAWEDDPAIPYVSFKDADGTTHRAALTAPQAAAYRRLDAWKQELAPEAALDTARREAATTAIRRIVEYLTGVGQASTPADGLQAVPPTPVAPPTPQPQPTTTDPYIDSFLCTSCNDCRKVNPRLFLYDGNKQAYLGPLSHGTFADLVKAAEGCPAKCIHPGTPSPSDASATPAVLARATKLR